jgi:hypothetical protein
MSKASIKQLPMLRCDKLLLLPSRCCCHTGLLLVLLLVQLTSLPIYLLLLLQ